MNKIVVFVLGPDKPGIIASIAGTLFEQGCNLEDVSQTILQTEFMGIFIASMEDTADAARTLTALQAEIAPMGLFVHLRPMPEGALLQPAGEPFVITTVGPDKPGLVAGITGVLAQYGVNITNLKAVSRGHGDNQSYIMIYEVNIPTTADKHLIRTALYERAQSLGLDLNLQHREIFEQIHRV